VQPEATRLATTINVGNKTVGFVNVHTRGLLSTDAHSLTIPYAPSGELYRNPRE